VLNNISLLVGGTHTQQVVRTSVGDVRTDGEECNLVDSASSHMLVSKIKPCMSKYMPY
jgi:hypothetical protein